MDRDTQQPDRRRWTGAGTEVEAQETIELPERETLSLVPVPALPTLGPVAAGDQTTASASSALGDAAGAANGFANDAIRTAPTDQNTASAQNVDSPGSTASVSQSQYAPVTAPPLPRRS